MSIIMNKKSTLFTAIVAALISVQTHAASGEVTDPSLEDLLKVEVTTASRKTQQVNDIAAAVFVITRDDIQRSGATVIPEVLRLAPGVNVARMAANRYAVSVRGFNGRFANKLLVLIDGRSTYSPVFSGVLWELEDTLLEDVERIEVIRGPGGALWGANAVNAVINIITRKSRDTTGTLLVAGSGTSEHVFGAARHGGALTDGHYRVWTQTNTQEGSIDKKGNRAGDDARSSRVGFRADWMLSGGNRFTVSGAAYDVSSGDKWFLPSLASPIGVAPVKVTESGRGGHVLARHEWALSGNSEAALQAYINHSDLKVSSLIEETRTTADIDFQYRTVGHAHDVIWGLGYRHSPDRVTSDGTYQLNPARRTFSLTSAFVQDEWTVVPGQFRVIGGLRIEHNNFTGVEPLPNVRAIWTPSRDQSLWAAASRAIRTPSRGELDAELNVAAVPATATTPAILTRRVTSTQTEGKTEKVNTLELGYRIKLSQTLSIDVAAYRSEYDDLLTGRLGERQFVLARPAPYVLQATVSSNQLKAKSHGIELTSDWQITPWWRIQPSYAYFDVSVTPKIVDPAVATSAYYIANGDPRHQFSLRSSMNFAKQHQLDFWLRHVGELRANDPAGGHIPAYTELDAHYAWHLGNGVDLSVGGRNLLKRRHAEYTPDLLPSEPLAIERNFYFKARWNY
jgi:iron complex outermembrane recepter protein